MQEMSLIVRTFGSGKILLFGLAIFLASEVSPTAAQNEKNSVQREMIEIRPGIYRTRDNLHFGAVIETGVAGHSLDQIVSDTRSKLAAVPEFRSLKHFGSMPTFKVLIDRLPARKASWTGKTLRSEMLPTIQPIISSHEKMRRHGSEGCVARACREAAQLVDLAVMA